MIKSPVGDSRSITTFTIPYHIRVLAYCISKNTHANDRIAMFTALQYIRRGYLSQARLILSTSAEFFYPTTTSTIMTFGTHVLDGLLYLPITVERRLSERQSSETSNIRTHIFFVLRSNNEKSAITSRSKVLCHFY